MNLTRLSEKELLDIINNTKDLVTLEAAECEWVRRFCPVDIDDFSDYSIDPKEFDEWKKGGPYKT